MMMMMMVVVVVVVMVTELMRQIKEVFYCRLCR